MIIDVHIHFDSTDVYDRLMADIEREGADQFCVLVIDRHTENPADFKQAQGIWIKWKNPKRVFLFGGIDWITALKQPSHTIEKTLIAQVERMKNLGFDGVKLLLGKPMVRKALDIPLDDSRLQPLFHWFEETGFPMLWHVGDPPEFWDEKAVPLWARQNKWWYDETYPPKAQIDREIANVMARHPRMNLILPHLFFLSHDLEEAARVLEWHPNIYFDLAPGVEWMHNMAKNPERSREFFVRYADRIIFGTDIGLMMNASHPDRGVCIRRFLETADTFPIVEDFFMYPSEEPPLQGLQLPADVLEKIYSVNFHRMVGHKTPLPLDKPGNLKYISELVAQEKAFDLKESAAAKILADLQSQTPV
ncbi:MAG: amidohydrolase family protein [Chthoniobacterales bacterium]